MLLWSRLTFSIAIFVRPGKEQLRLSSQEEALIRYTCPQIGMTQQLASGLIGSIGNT